MARQILLKLVDGSESATATLLDEEERETCDVFWDELENPVKMWLSHTASTGDYIIARGRPEREPQQSGTQANPLGNKKVNLSDLGRDAIVYSGRHFIALSYGPDNTEPVPAPGPIVARADDLNEFYKLGRYVWEKHKKSELVLMTVERKKD